MKNIFTLLLICLLANSLSAQNESEDWTIFGIIQKDDGTTFAKRYNKHLRLDTIKSGPKAGITFGHLQEKVELSPDCSLLLPEDEYIWKWNEHFIISTQKIYEEPYQTRVTSYQIVGCELQLLGSRMVPMEHELHINDQGEILLSDMYMGYGRKLMLVDNKLQIKASYIPFEKGFTFLHAEDAGDHWWVILTEESKDPIAGLYKLDKASLALEKWKPLPFQPEGWNGFTSHENGFFIYRYGELMSFDLTGEKQWVRAEEMHWCTEHNDRLLLLKSDSISSLDAKTGKQFWAWNLAELHNDKRSLDLRNLDPEERDLLMEPVYSLFHELKQNDKGVFLITYRMNGGWTVPGLKKDIHIILIDHSGKILFNQRPKGSYYSIQAFLHDTSFTLFLDDEKKSYEIPE